MLRELIERVWNSSVEAVFGKTLCWEKDIKKVLLTEIDDTYNLSDEIRFLVSAGLKISPILFSLRKECDLPINLKRLVYLSQDIDNSLLLRKKFALRFPVEKVVLCEGITEEILLPKFAKLAGFDFESNGIKLIGAGGKNQVAKLYYELKDELKLPIFILLDADAKPTSELISPKLRDGDRIYLIQNGEFEDIFSLNLIKRTINHSFKNICECIISDFKSDIPMTKVLTEFYRKNELGDFQKADFAKALADTLKYKTDLTDEILSLIEAIKSL